MIIPRPEFSRYGLNFEIFPTKTKFVNWMKDHGATRDEDYKNIEKIQKEGQTVVTMEIRNKLIDKIKNEKYDGKSVLFTLI